MKIAADAVDDEPSSTAKELESATSSWKLENSASMTYPAGARTSSTQVLTPVDMKSAPVVTYMGRATNDDPIAAVNAEETAPTAARSHMLNWHESCTLPSAPGPAGKEPAVAGLL